MKDYYYLTGSDGSGKTTFIEEIEGKLEAKKIKTTYIWLRSPKITSKPLMAYCRMVGLTEYTIIDNVKYGIHNFHKSKFVSKVFPYLQFIDFKIKWFFKKIKIPKGNIILFDRFNIDTLADLMVDTKNLELHKSKLGKKFLKFIPDRSNLIILMVDEDIIRKRKKDTLYDQKLKLKLKVYKRLADDLDIKIIYNNFGIEETKRQILNHFNI